MTMPKSTQTRFLGIIDNQPNHYTSLRLLFLIIITDLLMSIYSRHAILGVRVLDLHVGEIHVLPVST